MSLSRTQYLNKYGGTTSNTFQINTQNLTTENLVVRGNVIGTINIDTAIINNAIINTQSITGDLHLPQNLDISGNINLSGTSNLVFPTPYGIQIYQPDASNNSIVTQNSSNISMATLSLMGNNNNIYVASSSNSTLNTIAQNVSQFGVQVGSDTTSASMYFYNNSHITSTNNSTNTQDSTITSKMSIIDASQSILSLNGSLNIANINTQNTTYKSAVYINDFSASNIFASTNTTIYSPPNSLMSPYNYAVYNNSNISIGNALSLYASSDTAVTYLNINTPNHQTGMRLGGGNYPQASNYPQLDNQRSISSLDIKDIYGNYKPIQTIVTNSDHVINPATMGINTYTPIIDASYVLDVNGQMIVHNTQFESVLQIVNTSSINISGSVSTVFSRSNPLSGITCYYSSQPSLIIWYSQTGGKQWSPSSVPSDISYNCIKKCIVYDNNYSIVLVSNIANGNIVDISNTYLMYYSVNGGANYYKSYVPMNQTYRLSSVYFIYAVNQFTQTITVAGNSLNTSIGSSNTIFFNLYDINSTNIGISSLANTTTIASTINTYLFTNPTTNPYMMYDTSNNFYISPTTTVDYNSYNNSIFFVNQNTAISNTYMTLFNTTMTSSSYNAVINNPSILPNTTVYTNIDFNRNGNYTVIYSNTNLVSFDSTNIVTSWHPPNGSTSIALSTIYYSSWDNPTINDAFIIDNRNIIVAGSASITGCPPTLYLTSNAGQSWDTSYNSFSNYNGNLFSGDSSFNQIHIPDPTNSNLFFIVQSQPNNNYVDYYGYNPYIFNAATCHMMDICGGLTVYGNISATGVISSPHPFQNTSDYRIKDGITTISGDMLLLDRLNPVHYTNRLTNRKDFGLIAHELQQYYPELVTGEKDGDEYQSVNYTGLISILIKEIQVLKGRVAELEMHSPN